MINILIEHWLWLSTIYCTFGLQGLGLSAILLIIQACSYGDVAVASLLSIINVGTSWSVWRIAYRDLGWDIVEMTAIAKIALF